MNLLTAKQLSQKLSCHDSYIWHLQKKDPSFPKPLRIGMGTERTRGTRWVDGEVTAWLLTKKQQSNHNEEVQHEDGRSGTEIHTAEGKEVPA